MNQIKYKKGEKEYKILHMAMDHENICILGPGGSGKTTLLEVIIKHFEKEGMKIGISSTTGISALVLGGVTTHRLFGIGLGKGTKEYLYKYISTRRLKTYKFLSEVDVIIIDEVSMLSRLLFDKLDYIMKQIRNKKRFFGGVQLILSGDFLQLPPINAPFAFTSDIWQEANNKKILKVGILNKCRRYVDKKYFDFLQRVRTGKISEEDIEKLKSRYQAYNKECINGKFYDIINGKKVLRDFQPIRLFPKKEDVWLYNARRLKEINSVSKTYYSIDKVEKKDKDTGLYLEIEDRYMQNKFKSFPVNDKLELKLGCQVMCTRNQSNVNIVNGSIGVVTDLKTDSVFVKFKEYAYPYELGCERWSIKYEDLRLTRKQIPLILSYAITIHKSQSKTLDSCVIDIGSIFAKGQAYVALSRCKYYDKVYIKDFNVDKIEAHPDALDYMGF